MLTRSHAHGHAACMHACSLRVVVRLRQTAVLPAPDAIIVSQTDYTYQTSKSLAFALGLPTYTLATTGAALISQIEALNPCPATALIGNTRKPQPHAWDADVLCVHGMLMHACMYGALCMRMQLLRV